MINTRKIAFQGVRIKKEHYKNAIHAFSHPDYTVGTGITPVHAIGSQTLLPVGNHTLP